MPLIFIEGPQGIRPEAKQTLMREVTDALTDAYRFPDVRVFVREHPAGNVAQDGRSEAEDIRPVCFLEVPELRDLDARRVLTKRIQDAVSVAYQGIANTEETLVMINHYPLENVGFHGRLQSDDPQIVGLVDQLNR
ncbi:tautomerase family protein [Nonomuraea diastatica]|uniref:N-acetylmuramic acid 6-phosphate etherase n=1 Tax=Nonomuraea diastatica TaxID=1848329 RepID=A0A4R4VLD4_9ACTN|nr:tautomerase family protein [Nonomuraea diastatica]TDD03144.1 N-acetylmuramic acid 6-phosphate etherase [Nonomuraea diastatica]